MNFKRSLFLIALLCTIGFVHSAKAEILTRSQSVDSARELVGWAHQVNLFDMGGSYGTFAITPEYTRSFRADRLARCLFGSAIGTCNEDCPFLKISGSRVADRGPNDLLADYFGLPTDFQSTVTVHPRIENFLVDFDAYFGLDDWMCGLWFRVHAPVVHARWKLNLCENVISSGTLGYDAGYFTPLAVARTNLLPNFTSYLSGNVPTLNGGDVVFQPLRYNLLSSSNINNCCFFDASSNENKTRLSEVQLALGWNFWQDYDYHVGLGVRVSIPTGTRIDSRYLFAPVIGNGHHFEVGGMFTSHYTFWRDCDDTRSLGIYVDANITTLLNTCQLRTFDLCGRGELSRFMLAAQFISPARTSIRGSAEGFPTVPTSTLVNANSQFNNIYTPVANIAVAKVNVSVPVQVDLTAMFNYQQCNWEFDLGYNFWTRTCERINKCISNNCLIPNNTYVLKGDAAEFGYPFNSGAFGPAVALSASQSQATIFSGLNFNGTNTLIQAAANPNIDHPLFAYTINGNFPLFINNTVTPPSASNPQIRTSINPVFLNDASLDFAGARRQGITHKFFTHLSYTWNEKECYVPYVGIGGKVEFAQYDKKSCSTNCGTTSCAQICAQVTTGLCAASCFDTCGDSCKKCAVSEWGVWIKGGFGF